MKSLHVRAVSFFIAVFIAVSGIAFFADKLNAATEETLLIGSDSENPSTPSLINVFESLAGSNVRNINSFQKGSNPPSSAKAIDVGRTGSVVAWSKEVTVSNKKMYDIYWYSKASKVYLNERCTGMFIGCKFMTTCDLSGLDSSRVTKMGNMFYQCANLKKIKGLDKFNTSNVTSMAGM